MGNIFSSKQQQPTLSPSLNSVYNTDYDLPQNISKLSPASSNLINSTTNQTISKNILAPISIIDDYKIPNNNNQTFLSTTSGSGTSTDPYRPAVINPNTNIILPYLIEGKTVQIDNAIIVRNNNKINVTIDNKSKSYNIGESIIINDKIYRINAIEDFNNNIIEHLPGISLSVESAPRPITNKPTTFYDYIFYLCYPVSFAGAIFYGVTCIISTDPSTILINKNWSVAFNIYVGLCAIMSVFIWFNYPNPILGTSSYNPKSFRKSL